MRRRSMIGTVLAMVGTLATGILGLAGGFLANALGRRSERPWIRVGPAEGLSAEGFERIVLSVERRHAFIERSVATAIYVMDLYPKDPIALLPVCSHLGCAVHWSPDEKLFLCPCHGGVYDEQGKVVAGPPPRPLSRLETKVDGDDFFVRLPPRGARA